MKKLIKIFIILTLTSTVDVNAQIDKSFFLTKDTIYIENPIIISEVNRNGLFVMNSEYLEQGKRVNIKKMLKEGKAYVYSNEIFRFLSLNELQNKNINYVNCDFTEMYNFDKKIIIRKLSPDIKNFIVGFVNTKFYNKKIITADKGKTIFNDDKDFIYQIILFPICQ